jgi:hypothetical protein
MSRHKPPGRAVTSRDRISDSRPQRQSILIVCEGEQTEPNYFQAIIDFHRLNTVILQVEVIGAGRGALSLTKYALDLQKKGVDRYAQIWCVFDKDDFKADAFDNAISRAEGHSFLRVAWSNEAFELWYVLHFQYLDAAPGYAAGPARDYYKARLTDLLRPLGRAKYEKNDPTLYAALGPKRLQTAISFARRLQAFHPAGIPCHRCIPATTVHELVELLLSYAPEHQHIPSTHLVP